MTTGRLASLEENQCRNGLYMKAGCSLPFGPGIELRKSKLRLEVRGGLDISTSHLEM